jgi:hypothetical protein
MRRTPGRTLAVVLVVALACLPAGAGPAGADGVAVALTPGTIQVEPGAEFDLDVTVPWAGASFNGFEMIVGWDPDALTPVARAEGTLMTAACATRFHYLRSGADADTIADALLCAGVSVTGPGQIYRLRFRASLTPQLTAVLFRSGPQFYDAGLYVPLAQTGQAAVGIGMTPLAAEPPAAPARLQLRIAPNPARGGTVFAVGSDRAGPWRLRVTDTRGRLVRRLDAPADTPGVRSVPWDGCDAGGRPVPPGIYLVTLEVAGTAVTGRVAVLR